MTTKDPLANGIRWTARITGTLLVLFTLFMAVGYSLDGRSGSGGNSWRSMHPVILILFLFWGIGLAGLLLALWREGLGAAISLAGFLLTGIFNLFNPETPSRLGGLLAMAVFSLPSLLYLCYWLMTKEGPKES